MGNAGRELNTRNIIGSHEKGEELLRTISLCCLLIGIISLVFFAQAETECIKPCTCLAPDEAILLGYELCGGEKIVCGYDRFKDPLYCYQPPPEDKGGMADCPGTCTCMAPEEAETIGYEPCMGEMILCGYDRMQNPLFCYEPLSIQTPAPEATLIATLTVIPPTGPVIATCPESCECMRPYDAEREGLTPCPNFPDPCGYDESNEFMYCFLPFETAFEPCPDGCGCMHPEDAENRGFTPCPETSGPCGADEAGELYYCFIETQAESIQTPIIVGTVPTAKTLPPTYVAVITSPTPTVISVLIPPTLAAISLPTCYDGIQNQDETGIDCGGTQCAPCNRCAVGTLPDRFDWRDYVNLPPIWLQGGCGSCWAFSAIGAVEGTSLVEHGNTPDLSEQAMVSACGCSGTCDGGWPHYVLKYTKNNGAPDEACFPYVASDAACTRCSGWEQRLWQIGYYGSVGSGIDEIKRALICHGPLSVCSKHWSHCIVLVGYDDSAGSWIIRNSHGTGYGTGGYGSIPYSGHTYSDIKDYVKYTSAVGRGFEVNFEENDGLCAGDVNGDGKAEIIHGDRGDAIRVYTVTGAKLADWTLDFEGRDGLAAGDPNSDGTDEIIHFDRGNWIRVYTMTGSMLEKFRFDFEGGDGCAAGDVDGDGMDELVHGDRVDLIRIVKIYGGIL